MKIISFFLKFIIIKKFFVFISPHSYFNSNQFIKIKKNIKIQKLNLLNFYEDLFSKNIGEGRCVSFASARMGLYSILSTRDLSKEDEVIVLGSTCSVVVNSILKIGSKIVFSLFDG